MTHGRITHMRACTTTHVHARTHYQASMYGDRQEHRIVDNCSRQQINGVYLVGVSWHRLAPWVQSGAGRGGGRGTKLRGGELGVKRITPYYGRAQGLDNR